METVRFGYELPFREIPPPSHEPTNRSAREDLTFVRAEVERLEKLGCILRVEKKPPDTRILFLGLEICSKTMKFYIPEKKLHFILSVIDSICSSRKNPAQKIASFLGYLQSCARAHGKVVRLMARASYHWMAEKLATNPSYNMYYQVPEEVKYELLFWEANIRILKGFEINPSQSLSETRLTIVPDASADGAFGFEISDRYRVILRQSFSKQEKKASSTEREMLALRYIYGTNISWAWRGMRILNLTDNYFSLDDYSFVAMMSYFPEVSIDINGMAEWWNKKSSVYFSRDEDVLAAGTNFFAQELDQNYSVFIFPPARLIVPVILLLVHFKSRGLLIVPAWPSASF